MPLAEAGIVSASCLLDKSWVNVSACPESEIESPVPLTAIRLRIVPLSSVLPDADDTLRAACFAANNVSVMLLLYEFDVKVSSPAVFSAR